MSPDAIAGSLLSDMSFNCTEAEIASKNPSRLVFLYGRNPTTQLGRFPSIQVQVAAKNPFALHRDLDVTCAAGVTPPAKPSRFPFGSSWTERTAEGTSCFPVPSPRPSAGRPSREGRY